jgi:hypothetical protein
MHALQNAHVLQNMLQLSHVCNPILLSAVSLYLSNAFGASYLLLQRP